MEGRQRIIGTFAAQLDLTNFPRDTQTLPVTFISLEHGPDELKFVFESVSGEEVFSETGWSARYFAKSSLPDPHGCLCFYVACLRVSGVRRVSDDLYDGGARK